MKLTESRIGKFYLNGDDLIETNFQIISKIMSKVIIFKAESDYINDCIRYEAYCKEFDLLAPGEMMPEYVIRVFGDNVYFVRQTRDYIPKIEVI